MEILQKIKKHKFWAMPVLFLLILFLLFLIPMLIWPSTFSNLANPESIQNFILPYKNWAIFIYVLISIAVVVAPPLPNDIVPIAGGMLFGFWVAFLFGIIARIIGSSINYILGIQIRKGVYIKFISPHEQEKLKHYTQKIGWQAVFISRFLPSTDTDLIAYLAGIVKMDYIKFIFASFLGMLVPVSFMIFMGSSFFTNKYLFFALIAFYIVGVLFAPFIIKRVIKHKNVEAKFIETTGK